ncbi:MAG TPA: ADOP family duplicated permease [Candidatus Acidoferrum sp.]|nr:ADOP family duplicated permease [Candidatus Acidoferrum sp.]
MGEFFRRLSYLWNRSRREQELSDEMEFHREMVARSGHTDFGNALHLREESRDAWGWTAWDRLRQDLRYAARMLWRAPGFTMSAVLILAIGIGVNVAVFGFFDLMVLRPLDIRDPATLLRFHRRSAEAYAYSLPYPAMAFYREHAKTLSAVIALNLTRVAVEGENNHLEAHFVTADFFTELGATALLGRTLLSARDDAPDAEPGVVLSYGFWQRHFGGDLGVVGRKIEVNGKPATIVGVAPREFNGLSPNVPALWTPLGKHSYFVSGSKLFTDFSVESPGVQMFGRLRPGMNPRAAETELGLLAAELRRQLPQGAWEKETLPSQPGGFASSLLSANRRGTGTEDPNELYIVLGLVGALALLILAVACANLGSLLLARGVAREREISIRLAVGAGSGRLVRQLFTESLLLALLGSAAGVALGYLVLRTMLTVTGAPAWMNAEPDWRVAAFAVGAGFAAAILFGLMPALQIARRRHRTTVLRQFLIAAQVAASCVLLIVAGLLGRALEHAMSAHPGFEYERVIAIDPGLGKHGYAAAKARAYLDDLRARLAALPGVQSTSLALVAPLGNGVIGASVTTDGHSLNVVLNHVDPEFLHTMKLPLVRGRNFERGDKNVVVVGESLARSAWPGQDPIGKKFTLDGDYTVVGVAGTARMVKMEDSDAVEVYMPIDPNESPGLNLLVRTDGSPEELARSAQAAARSMDAATFPEVQLLKAGMRRRMENAQTAMVAVGAMGGVAHLLACLGIAGVVAYTVSQRTKEIGLRMALGAKPGHVLAVVLGRLILPVALGLIAGIGGAAALSNVLRGQLFGISNLDAVTYLSAVGVFAVTAVIAAVLPARRALRVDPLRALRWE